MKLKKVFKGINIGIKNNIEINKIEIDSRKVEKGDMFVAIKGFENDGHNYIDEAINKGASVILINEDRLDEFVDKKVIVLATENTREILSLLANNYYNNPSKHFKLIGVTGTKGKTLTTYIIKNILNKANKKVGLIGTIATSIDDKKIKDNDRTTPEPIELQKTFDYMKKEKCKYVVMEVSSQSLKLGRVNDSNFDYGIFLNLSEEHVSKNEHKDMDEYFYCKSLLFDMVKKGFVNIDDYYGKKLIDLKQTKYKTFSIDDKSNKQAYNIEINEKYTKFETKVYGKNEEFITPLIGKFIVYDMLAAISLCEELKIDVKYIKEGIKDIFVPGREEKVINDYGYNIIIDYAHNSSSLENILKTYKDIKNGKLITVFGCAGRRGKVKRKEMGRISGTYSDYTIITEDNPIDEDPKIICKEIEEGIKEKTNNYEIIIDREKAIYKAIKLATKEDIIILAGKGHETYQLIGKDKIPFIEKNIVLDALKELK
ncbi:MAG: UDP-N-acetylmuramoyl-L-alanyl-D-glutamate--2,6-diaminopimelate ligase [Bacilli bacterium]|nr:UDP-N-acetylmuramoyl-L-alanyl-D-glutamate--2,6-diaminopimelate ligase [Bacilli bacterium]